MLQGIYGLHVHKNVIGAKSNFNVFSVYSPPSSDKKDFTTRFDNIINKHKNSIYIGDFNLNLLINDTNVIGYRGTVYSAGHIFLNKKITLSTPGLDQLALKKSSIM